MHSHLMGHMHRHNWHSYVYCHVCVGWFCEWCGQPRPIHNHPIHPHPIPSNPRLVPFKFNKLGNESGRVVPLIKARI